MAKIMYKFLRTGMESETGGIIWTLGKWRKARGAIKPCANGYHASPTIQAALGYIRGEILAVVECRGDHVEDGDKSAWREMRVIEAVPWTVDASRLLAVHAAELAAHLNPDPRVRAAIDAAWAVIKHDTPETRAAAGDAGAAAWAAGAAAGAAAGDAGAAAWAAAGAAARVAAGQDIPRQMCFILWGRVPDEQGA